LTRKKN